MKREIKAVVFEAGILLAACSITFGTLSAAKAESVFVTEFDQGDDAPTGWQLSNGQGRWVDRRIVEVTGTGSDSNYWQCDGYQFTPGALYHFQMRARRPSGSGCVISGPSFANRDYSGLSNDWKWYGHVFRAPQNTEGAFLRLGQWQAEGSVQFDAVRLVPALPVHRITGGLALGEGETIRDGVYQFHGTFGHPGSNYHRTLQTATAGFNSDRWTFGPGSQITYRFEVPGHDFLSGQVNFNVNHHTRGACLAEASRDQTAWRPLVAQDGLGSPEARLPEDWLPARSIFLRLRPSPDDSSFQVNQVEFQAKLSGAPPEGSGKTDFADVHTTSPRVVIREMAVEEDKTSPHSILRVVAENTSRESLEIKVAGTAAPAGGPRSERPLTCRAPDAALAPGESGTCRVEVSAQRPGEHHVDLSVGDLDRPTGFVRATWRFSVPEYYRTDYGERIAAATGSEDVWWCPAPHKIPRQRPMPTKSAPAARLSAAKHDYEAVQVVVRPQKTLKGLTAAPGPLAGPGGATIPARNVRILRVFYHFVDQPTDSTGVRDWWPDALPPLDQPIDVPPGENQPLWVLVYVPKGAKAGDYSGEIRLRATGWSAAVPIRLHVWDFALPERNHVETAFGLSEGNIFRYHQLKTDEDQRRVLDMYFQSFAEHRISPYDPTPLDRIGVQFLPEADPPRAQVDFSAFDPEMARVVEKFHFTGLCLPIQGMGGGSFHARYEPKIGDYGEQTPQYQATFSSYVKQLEDHLRAKGWLDMAYVYWFDEPAPRDYDFVTNGMERLKKYAPGLRRMLTEEPGDELKAPVDVWCPVSPNYDHAAAERRRARGERFWWYVCTGPKAPYCTLFIDHPATELRVWLWQTWQRNILGVLVWQSNYWTSTAAFPDAPQNPYEDPMGYVSGYSTPRGVKRYWGNGDGRFIYPPLAAASPGEAGPDPVLEPPVSSIRWEMLREGIEDYEYLHLLRELIAQRRNDLPSGELRAYEALLEVPESITKDMTTFTTDPAPIYARRAQVAEAIERLAE